MKKIVKKNQVIITALAVLIAVAGYLNFADVDLGFTEKEASTDSSSILQDIESLDYDLTDETALLEENAKEQENSQKVSADTGTALEDTQETAAQEETAQTASSEMANGAGTPGEAVLTSASNFAAQAKLSREQVRAQNKESMQEIIDNPDIDQEQKQNAINTIVSMTEMAEKEAAAELLLEAKGFANVVVNLTGETVDVVVPQSDLSTSDRAQIEDIVKRKTGIAAENIVITPLSQVQEEAQEQESQETSGESISEESQESEETSGGTVSEES